MARRGKSSPTRDESLSEWPSPSSPQVPPTVNFYFMRQFMDGRLETPGMVVNFLHKWQAGVFLREVLEGAEDIEHGPLPEIGGQEDEREGSSLHYMIVTERDSNGEAVRARRFVGKVMGATFEELMKRSEAHTDIRLPYSMDHMRRAAIGMGMRSPEAYAAGNEAAAPVPQDAGLTKREQREKRKAERAARPPKEERAPRPSREGLTSLTSICAGEGVEPGDVRAALRGMKIEKPEAGWAWAGEVPAYVAKAIKLAKEKRK